MKMKKIITILILFAFSNFSFAIVGLADWQYVTTKGNVFNDYQQDGISLSISKAHIKIDNIERWYFYDDFIIGEHLNDSSRLEYFFVNEINSKVVFFDTFEKASTFSEANNLKPLLWTRWFSEKNTDDVLVFLINFFSFLIIIIFLFVFLYRFFKKSKSLFYKNEKKFWLIFGVFLLIINLLDNYKMSF